MSKYTLTIEGDFGRFECYKCPCFVEIELCCDERAVRCAFGGNYEECPLEEVKQGEWIVQDETYTKFTCSVCGSFNHAIKWKFCPICGTEMRIAT